MTKPGRGALIIVCRYCRRKLHYSGLWLADDNDRIYCQASRGQHVPVAEEPETSHDPNPD